MAIRRRAGMATNGAAKTRAGIKYLIQIQAGRSSASVNGRYCGRYQAQLAVRVSAFGIWLLICAQVQLVGSVNEAFDSAPPPPV